MGQIELLNVHENNHEKTHDCQKRSPFSPGERHKRDAATREAFAEIMGPITSTIAQDVRQAKKQKKQKKTRCHH